MEDGEPKAFGAGLLSSFGELEQFRSADLRTIDFHQMGTQEYDVTKYQPILYMADSMEELEQRMTEFFDNWDEDQING